MIGDLQPGLRRDRLLAIALLHDTAEALIGDLPASARRLFGARAKQEAERKAMLELFSALPQCDEYMELWLEYVSLASPEARLVKALDRLEMLLQAHLYERAGSRGLAEFWEECDNGWSDEFPAVRDLAARLIAQRNHLVDGHP